MIITDGRPKLHQDNTSDINISTYQIPVSSAAQYGYRDHR